MLCIAAPSPHHLKTPPKFSPEAPREQHQGASAKDAHQPPKNAPSFHQGGTCCSVREAVFWSSRCREGSRLI